MESQLLIKEWKSECAFVSFVPHMPTCITCSRLLCTCVSSYLCLLRAFLFSGALGVLIFLRASCASFLPALRVFLFYVPYVSPSFTSCVTYIHIFTCLACPHFLRALRAFIILLALGAFIFLRAYVLFMAMLIKLTQINEHLSPFIKYFHFYKARVIFLFKY